MKPFFLAFFMMLALTSFNFTKDTRKHMFRQEEMEVRNERGLNDRAAAKLSQLVAKYRSGGRERVRVYLTYKNRRVEVLEIMDVMILQAKKGALIIVECEGGADEKEEECFNAIKALFENKFGDKE
jgi:phosphocarrier protein